MALVVTMAVTRQFHLTQQHTKNIFQQGLFEPKEKSKEVLHSLFLSDPPSFSIVQIAEKLDVLDHAFTVTSKSAT